MKEYVIDQVLFLAIGIWIMIFIPTMCGHILILMIIFELMAGLSFGYLCRRILVLPLDILLKKRTEIVYFSRMNTDLYEFFKGKYYCEWVFYSSKGTISVLVPVALCQVEILNMEKPVVNQKVRICFYRFSKILYSWEGLERVPKKGAGSS